MQVHLSVSSYHGGDVSGVARQQDGIPGLGQIRESRHVLLRYGERRRIVTVRHLRQGGKKNTVTLNILRRATAA